MFSALRTRVTSVGWTLPGLLAACAVAGEPGIEYRPTEIAPANQAQSPQSPRRSWGFPVEAIEAGSLWSFRGAADDGAPRAASTLVVLHVDRETLHGARASVHPSDAKLRILVDGRFVGTDTLSVNPDAPLPGGWFESEREARELYAGLGVELLRGGRIPATPERYSNFMEESFSSLLWGFRCQPEKLSLDEVAEEILDYLESRAAERDIQCSSEPMVPRLVPPDCRDADASGDRRGGVQVGTWYFYNAEHEQIRIERYDSAGDLVARMWLQGCERENPDRPNYFAEEGVELP